MNLPRLVTWEMWVLTDSLLPDSFFCPFCKLNPHEFNQTEPNNELYSN